MDGTIEGGRFRALVSSLGAELKSLVDTATGIEYIWRADPAWWKGSAPVLFPIVGSLRGGKYRHAGAEYALPQHGFARTSEFDLVAKAADAMEFELRSTPATKANYPFDFSLRVCFAVERSGISVRYVVKNSGAGPLWFSIGSHPAINVPFEGGKLENHYVLFDRSEDLDRHFFKDGLLVAGKTAEVFENSRTIPLSRSIFDDGPIILKGPRSTGFSIVNGMSGKLVLVATDGVPYVGIWSKPNAPFLCIEPWHGVPDSTEAGGELAEKEGIIRLEAGNTFSTGYRIEPAR
jgi:galactose mutarotase-like enzyme